MYGLGVQAESTCIIAVSSKYGKSSMPASRKSVVLNDDNPYRDQIKLWKRYIDDVLLIWTGSKEEAIAYATWLNGANPFLTFTMNIGDNRLPFLDLLIYEHDGGLSTEVYYKPTDCNNLLQYQSFHPRALRDNLPVGQFLRLRRNCSSVGDYYKHADKLTIKLNTKDYPPHLIRRARKRARNNNRDQLLQPRASKPDLEKIVCVTTFNPLSNTIQKIIKDNCEKPLGSFPDYKRRNTSILTRPRARTFLFSSLRPPRVLPPLGLPIRPFRPHGLTTLRCAFSEQMNF
ncbi:hypothetical protein NDU88_005175 [Pleurodeles waltl]|uniref:Helix-turn-helix domain-containing protein n=1 Tax=Pleurodeles waltl TaxID=8319 RepID=A0AAV7PIU7_PLEWA|nr:hypothetical protein NDU88_005175 [Pleurodeles waltl]